MSHGLRIVAMTLALMVGSAAAPNPAGYLAGREPDTLAAIPQPPTPGSPRDLADRAIFRRTRALEGSPRWALAQSDADLSKLLADFDCALGVSLTTQNTPRLTALIVKAAPDISAAYNVPKDVFHKLRPFTRDAGDICVPRSSGFAKSYDYPSGHATWAWAVGLILARAAPDRAADILGRARAFGESRVVCGVHNASAVEAGRVAADTVVSALAGDAAFRDDLAAARSEITTLRSSGVRPDVNACRTEAALTRRTPW
ncbi:MAG TPA: phosphatase PAP2 family protein [Caulobacteraceae bacterium]|jgi:acid phosphatase (class A)